MRVTPPSRAPHARAPLRSVERLEPRTLFAGVSPLDVSAALANGTPVAVAGPPAGYVLGPSDESVRLDATASSGPDGDPLTFQWDLNNDGAFVDAEGATPELNWLQLQRLGVPANRPTPVRVRVSDGQGWFATSADVPLFVDRPHFAPWSAYTHGTVPRLSPGGLGYTYEAVALATPDLAFYTFQIALYGVYPLDEQTLDDRDVEVTAPDGAVQWATFVGLTGNFEDGNSVNAIATYRFAAPGGTVDVADAGEYAVRLAGTISDVFGNVVLSGLGPVRAMTESDPPTFSLRPVSYDGDSHVDFTVVYADATGVDPAAISASRLWIVPLDAPAQGVPTRFFLDDPVFPIGKAQGADGSWVVTYRLVPRQGSEFQPMLANGEYALRTAAGDRRLVKDLWGNTLVTAEVGRFTVDRPVAGPDVALFPYMDVHEEAFGMPGTRVTATTSISSKLPGAHVPGPDLSAPVDVTFLLSKDHYPSDDDITVATLPGQRVTSEPRRIRVRFRVPPQTPPWSYYLLAIADHSNLLNEPNEANNRAEAACGVVEPHVQFTIDLRDLPRARRGRRSWVTVFLENRGVVAARGTVRVDLELRREEGFTEHPVLSSKDFRINLPPGGGDGGGKTIRLRVPVVVPLDWPASAVLVSASLQPEGTLVSLEKMPAVPDVGGMGVD